MTISYENIGPLMADNGGDQISAHTYDAPAGQRIISCGVQTSGVQNQFYMVQCCVLNGGSSAYTQVKNASDSGTQWYMSVVLASKS